MAKAKTRKETSADDRSKAAERLPAGTRLYTVKDVAEGWHISTKLILMMIKTGEVSAIRTGREWRFTEKQLKAYIKRKEKEAAAEIERYAAEGGFAEAETETETEAETETTEPPKRRGGRPRKTNGTTGTTEKAKAPAKRKRAKAEAVNEGETNNTPPADEGDAAAEV